MGIGGQIWPPYYHTRGCIRCFSEKHIFDIKFNKSKKPF